MSLARKSSSFSICLGRDPAERVRAGAQERVALHAPLSDLAGVIRQL